MGSASSALRALRQQDPHNQVRRPVVSEIAVVVLACTQSNASCMCAELCDLVAPLSDACEPYLEATVPPCLHPMVRKTRMHTRMHHNQRILPCPQELYGPRRQRCLRHGKLTRSTALIVTTYSDVHAHTLADFH
jgi:hypothetical protein